MSNPTTSKCTIKESVDWFVRIGGSGIDKTFHIS